MSFREPWFLLWWVMLNIAKFIYLSVEFNNNNNNNEDYVNAGFHKRVRPLYVLPLVLELPMKSEKKPTFQKHEGLMRQ